jgi:HK97 family phage portal protein
VEWLNPDKCDVDQSNLARPRWFYDGSEISSRDMIHIPALVQPGQVLGVSPLKAFKTTFETGSAAQQTARDWFANGAIPSAHLKNNAQTMDPESADIARRRYKAAVKGRDVLVTGSDWSLTTIGVPADEARFIETLKLTATQVASIYGIPPEMIGGETGSSMTYSTVEQNSLNFVTYSLRPWLVRIEEALSAQLPAPQYVKFNIDALVRSDLLTRMQAHEIALRIGLETQDEGRAIEDRPPLSDAERAAWLDAYRPQPGGSAA